MTGFKVVSTIDEVVLKQLPISSLTLVVGELIELLAGATTWTQTSATSNYFSRKAIVYAAATSADTVVLAYEVRGNEIVEAASGTAAAAANGDRMLLTDSKTVNNTGTDNTSQNVCFVQAGLGSTTTSIVGQIIVGPGVDPDAT